MRSLSSDFTKYLMYFVFSFLAVGVSSCSSDDDAEDIIDPVATGAITVENNQTISQNTVTVQNVVVGQDSWLVAVKAGDENTRNFISEPVMVEAGTTSNVELTLNDDVTFTGGEDGDEISLILFAENTDGGNPGEWDDSDEPITDSDGTIASETITIFVANNTQAFADLDANADGNLDENEFPNSYQNNFTEWDTDGDGSLNDEEFANTTFGNTDADRDDAINQDEWNQGWASMYGNYAGEEDFATYDADANGTLSSEEWMTGFAETEWFTTYDADASTNISEDEWNTGLFGDWDLDGDGMINEDEYNNYSPYSGGW